MFSVLITISLDNHNWYRLPITVCCVVSSVITVSAVIRPKIRLPAGRVCGGERINGIFPYQENADAMFNSAMLYELAALRKFAEPILAEVRESDEENAEAYRLLRFLRYFNYIPDVGLPGTSLLREFLGGGSFRY